MRPSSDAPPRERILHLLKTRGPATAGELAGELGVTPMAVRPHLARLAAEGLLAHEDMAGQVGRPRRLWRLTPASAARFPDNHAELAVGVLEAARASFGRDGLARLVAARTQAQVAAYAARLPPREAPLTDRVAALARIREDEGYLADWEEAGDGTLLLVENHCPICAAARACVGLCDGELALFRACLGEGVEIEREEYLLEGDRRCVYRIRPRTVPSAGSR